MSPEDEKEALFLLTWEASNCDGERGDCYWTQQKGDELDPMLRCPHPRMAALLKKLGLDKPKRHGTLEPKLNEDGTMSDENIEKLLK